MQKNLERQTFCTRLPKVKVVRYVQSKGMVDTGKVVSQMQRQLPTRLFLLMRTFPLECSSNA